MSLSQSGMNGKLTLSELNGQVKKALTDHFTAPLWVMGEISELNVNYSGHCYLTLVEKDDSDDRIVAQARATIWSYTFRMLKPFFETTTGQPLAEGIKVLLQVSVEFHELYGYSLNVRNIDPAYSLGDLARRRREIILRLEQEGVLTMNKELDLPLAPQKIAVISSPTAAGYQDFMDQLAGNNRGFRFYTRLFPAVMQGREAERSIVEALESIYPWEDFFDAVVIIRGGGSQVDLSCFDNYNVAYHVTQFPLPVFTGIGHERDDSIVDMVAHTRLKTPTAVAEFVINGLASFEDRLNNAEQAIVNAVADKLEEENERLEELAGDIMQLARAMLENRKKELMEIAWTFRQETRLHLKNREHALESLMQRAEFISDRYFFKRRRELSRPVEMLENRLAGFMKAKELQLAGIMTELGKNCLFMLQKEKHRLDLYANKADLHDPAAILKKGYSITTSGGRLVRDGSMLNPGDEVKTRFYKGAISGKVTKIYNDDNHDS